MVLLGVLLLSQLGCQPVSVSAQAPPQEPDLRRQIELLNLINSLALTPEQMRFILEKAQKAQETRETLKAEADVEETEAVLVKIRDALMAGENVPGEVQDAVFAARAQHGRLTRAYKQEATRLAKDVEGVLESRQLYVLERYVPCVIPPENEPYVGRVAGRRGVALLERLRRVPADRFDRHKGRATRRVLHELERRFHRRIPTRDREKELHRILSLLERARSLSDAEFELAKEALIAELLAPYEASRPPVDVTSEIARHLLDPVIIPLLEQKVALTED
jgi:hypothetical protein